jgi:hypothetical protein
MADMLYCPSEEGKMTEPKLVTVYYAQGMLTAEVVKGRLESVGIPVFLRYEAVGQILGLTVDGLGTVEVQTPEEWADDALELLSDQDDDAEEH